MTVPACLASAPFTLAGSTRNFCPSALTGIMILREVCMTDLQSLNVGAGMTILLFGLRTVTSAVVSVLAVLYAMTSLLGVQESFRWVTQLETVLSSLGCLPPGGQRASL